MAWPEISIEDFPPERDDEPSSLRQDIIDELSDHFACALNRELLKNPDEQIAKQRVLSQFGDPIKIARQLWLDAMKEKIMSQRIMTGISAVMAVCSIAVVGIAWMLMKESQAFNQKMLAQLAAIVERPQQVASSNMDQQILQQLEQINQGQRQQAASPADEMNQISFQLVQNNKDKKPAVGFVGTLSKIGDKTDSFSVETVSDDTGKLEFGKLPWGKYSLFLSAPWGENYGMAVSVIPGRNYSQTIVCPVTAPEKLPVHFQVDWSDSLKSEDWLLLCDFRPRSYGGGVASLTRLVNQASWNRTISEAGSVSQTQVCLVDKGNQACLCPLSPYHKFESVDYNTLEFKPSINITEADSYILPVMCLVKKQDLTKLPSLNDNQKFMVLNHDRKVLTNFNPFISPLASGGFGGPLISTPTTVLFPFENFNSPADSRKAASDAQGIQLAGQLAFTVVQDQDNIWKIKLPELNQLKIPEGLIPVEGF